MTKVQFKKRIKALGLDPIQATVLFDFSHPARIYSQSEGVSSANEFRLKFFENEKKIGRLDIWIADKKDAIAKMRAKVNSERRKKYKRSRKGEKQHGNKNFRLHSL